MNQSTYEQSFPGNLADYIADETDRRRYEKQAREREQNVVQTEENNNV